MSKKWGCFLVLWALFLLIIGLVVCLVLYKYCVVYEQTRPEPLIEDFMNQMSAQEWYSAAENNCHLDLNEFEDAKSIYLAYIDDANTDDNKITYSKEVTLSNSDNIVYSIRSGISPIASVSLVPDDSVKFGFGRHLWKLGSISAPNILNRLNSYEVLLYAPSNIVLEVNGVVVDSKYISNNHATIPSLNKYESTPSLEQDYYEYNLGKMYGSVTVKETNGSEISAIIADNQLIYIAKPENTFSVKISAPEDVTVFVNNIALEHSDGNISYNLFEDISEFTNGDDYGVITYSISDFIAEPKVTALDKDGNSLIPIISGNKRYSFMHCNDNEAKDELTEVADEFFTRYRNYATSVYNPGTAGSLLNRCLRHSNLYEYIINSEDTMYWTTSIETKYSDIQFDNFSMVGDDCFVCSVKYKIQQTSTDWNETTDMYLDYTYELVFVNNEGTWLCAKMEAISE